MRKRSLPKIHWDSGEFTASWDLENRIWKSMPTPLPIVFNSKNLQQPRICYFIQCIFNSISSVFLYLQWINLILTVIFSNESEIPCDFFHKFKQNISFCVIGIQIPPHITAKLKLCFQNFLIFQGINYLVR